MIDINRYIRLWSELVDTGEMCALEMIKNKRPVANTIMILKKALDKQSQIHHQANIEILSKLSK